MGYKIREMRESCGLTQEELAEKSGVCRATIWALETNQNRITTTKTLMKIAQALNTTMDALFYTKSV